MAAGMRASTSAAACSSSSSSSSRASSSPVVWAERKRVHQQDRWGCRIKGRGRRVWGGLRARAGPNRRRGGGGEGGGGRRRHVHLNPLKLFGAVRDVWDKEEEDRVGRTIARFAAIFLGACGSTVLVVLATTGWRASDAAQGAVATYVDSAHTVVETETVAPPARVQLFQLVQAELLNLNDAFSVSGDSAGQGPVNAEEGATEARAIVEEVWETVDTYYLDARAGGFNRKAWQTLKEGALSQQLTSKVDAYRAVRRMLARGLSDRYTRFLSPSEYAAFAKYDITGIGLNLASAEEFSRKSGDESARELKGLLVLGLMKDSAAEKAGVSRGDEIVMVDGALTGEEGATPFEVASLIQGNEDQRGSMVKLAVSSVGEDGKRGPPRDVYIQRPEIARVPNPVAFSVQTRNTGKSLEKVGYIRVQEMNSLAQREVKHAIDDLDSQGAQSLVLDLRDNPGGLVQAGVAIAELFLDNGSTVVSSTGRTASAQSITTTSQEPLTRFPLTVLVNGRTASSSEILAAALQDNCRATLVGDRTFGKGLIQSVFELGDGSGLVLTVGKYLTPAGSSIDKEGIMPDYQYMPPSESAARRLQACTPPRKSR